jgi:hypothetical protein
MKPIATLLAALAFTTCAQADSYDPASNQLSIPLVLVGDTLYSNVLITVGKVLYVGGGTPFSAYDNYSGDQLAIPSVTVGAATYTNVGVTVGSVLKVGPTKPAFNNAAVAKLCPVAFGNGTYGNCKGTNDATTPDFFQPTANFFNAAGTVGKLTGGTRSDVALGSSCTLAIEPFIPLFGSTVNGKQDAGAAFKGLHEDTISVDASGNLVQITVGQVGVTTALEINAFNGHLEAVLFNAKGDYTLCTFR